MILDDPERFDRVCDWVRKGASYRDACAAEGVKEATWYSILERGRREDAEPLYVEFLEKLKRAKARGLVKNIAIIDEAAGEEVVGEDGTVTYKVKDWKAAAHLAALRNPEEYSLRYKIEHSGPQGEPIGVQVYLPEEDPE